MIGKGVLENCLGNSTFKLFVVYETKIKDYSFEGQHFLRRGRYTNSKSSPGFCSHKWCSRSMCLISRHWHSHAPSGLVCCGRFEINTSHFFTEKGTKYWEIDVVERVRVIGHHKCQGLIGLHNVSGAYWDGKFWGISKKTWAIAYLKPNDSDPTINVFHEYVEGLIITELVHCALPIEVNSLEKFVCQV